MKVETWLKALVGLVALTMALVAAIPYVLNVGVRDMLANQTAVAQKERDFLALRNLMRDIEVGHLGYVITGNETFLRPYFSALDAMPGSRKALQGRMQDEEERKTFTALEQAIDERLLSVEETMQARRANGFEAARGMVSTTAGGKDSGQIKKVRELIQKQIDHNADHRMRLRGLIIENIEMQANLALAVTAANAALLFLTLYVANSALRKSRNAEYSARQAADALEHSANVTTTRNGQLAGGAELMHALDLAESVDETCMIISRYFGRLLPKVSGSLYLYRNSRDVLERKAQWGADADDCDALELCDCWGLRRGGQHFADGEHALQCRHSGLSAQTLPRLCLPLVAQGDVIGCITVVGRELGGAHGSMQKQFVVQLSEQVALSMSNAQLRLKLRQQSIIDPLTELYNRRYMDETLKRELQRAKRRKSQLSLILVDLDHFKRVNDTYGHDTGDDLLRRVGEVLRQGIRTVDIACRFGGEELVVILPDCDMNAAVQRAERLRVAVAAIELSGRALAHAVTASFGVSSTSDGNDEVESLLRAADQALYTAKQTGRNRVVPAGLRAATDDTGLPVPEPA